MKAKNKKLKKIKVKNPINDETVIMDLVDTKLKKKIKNKFKSKIETDKKYEHKESTKTSPKVSLPNLQVLQGNKTNKGTINNNKNSKFIKNIKTLKNNNNSQEIFPLDETGNNYFKKSCKLKKHNKKNEQSQGNTVEIKSVNKPNTKLSLRDRMIGKLKGARFRYLNEQMYTNKGKEAKRYFEKDVDSYQAYHEGYRQQVMKWPINPVDVIIAKIRTL